MSLSAPSVARRTRCSIWRRWTRQSWTRSARATRSWQAPPVTRRNALNARPARPDRQRRAGPSNASDAGGKTRSRPSNRRHADRRNLLRNVRAERRWRELALGVGRGLAGALEAWLLAFLDAGIAGQEAKLAQRGSPLTVNADQRAGEAQLDRIGLAG